MIMSRNTGLLLNVEDTTDVKQYSTKDKRTSKTIEKTIIIITIRIIINIIIIIRRIITTTTTDKRSDTICITLFIELEQHFIRDTNLVLHQYTAIDRFRRNSQALILYQSWYSKNRHHFPSSDLHRNRVYCSNYKL